MVKRQITKAAATKSKPPEYLSHTCGDCGWGEFTHEYNNLDLNGKPICLYCPFTERRKRIRSEKACDKWKPKKEK